MNRSSKVTKAVTIFIFQNRKYEVFFSEKLLDSSLTVSIQISDKSQNVVCYNLYKNVFLMKLHKNSISKWESFLNNLLGNFFFF